ncbi:unnamed protein product [Paramecium sonneborni]|uniref:Uncharacterized protein n=1 Tax=Paramecium sonneborni TaxID=65129 RepID=A0A8S1LM78_9CILI|nr:unnamed protein product [Paramecium sonneborni]
MMQEILILFQEVDPLNNSVGCFYLLRRTVQIQNDQLFLNIFHNSSKYYIKITIRFSYSPQDEQSDQFRTQYNIYAFLTFQLIIRIIKIDILHFKIICLNLHCNFIQQDY